MNRPRAIELAKKKRGESDLTGLNCAQASLLEINARIGTLLISEFDEVNAVVPPETLNDKGNITAPGFLVATNKAAQAMGIEVNRVLVGHPGTFQKIILPDDLIDKVVVTSGKLVPALESVVLMDNLYDTKIGHSETLVDGGSRIRQKEEKGFQTKLVVEFRRRKST